MTVPYTRGIGTASNWASLRLLFRWKGSIWKSVSAEMIIWMFTYHILWYVAWEFNLMSSKRYADIYNISQNHAGKEATILDDCWIISLCRNFDSDYSVPLVMLLSFYSSKAFERWQYIFNNIAYSENLALTVNAFIRGSDRIAQLARQTVIRHVILAQILIYRDISISVKKRFPTLECLIDAGYLKADELKILQNGFNAYNVFSIPFCWITTLLTKLRLDGNIAGEPTYVNLITEIKEFRKKLETVYNFDCVPIPLAYPQIVSVAVRMHVVVCIIGKLFIFSKHEGIWMLNRTFLFVSGPEIFVFLAWLKVAEILANPLGEDDDDLELNHIIDRNYFIACSIIDSHDKCPILEETIVNPIPKYNEKAKDLGGSMHRLMGSAVGSKVDVGRMIEVEPTRRPELKKRECFTKWFDRDKRDDTLAIVGDGAKMGSSISIDSNEGVFCVKVPSFYDERNLRSLSEEEMDERRRDMSKSLIDMNNSSPLTTRRLSSSVDNIFDESSRF